MFLFSSSLLIITSPITSFSMWHLFLLLSLRCDPRSVSDFSLRHKLVAHFRGSNIQCETYKHETTYINRDRCKFGDGQQACFPNDDHEIWNLRCTRRGVARIPTNWYRRQFKELTLNDTQNWKNRRKNVHGGPPGESRSKRQAFRDVARHTTCYSSNSLFAFLGLLLFFSLSFLLSHSLDRRMNSFSKDIPIR